MNYLDKITKKLSKENFSKRFKTENCISLRINRKNNSTDVEFKASRSLRSGIYMPFYSGKTSEYEVKSLSLFFEYVLYANIEENFTSLTNKINEEHKDHLQLLYGDEEISIVDDLFGFSYPFFYKLSYDCHMMKERGELKKYANDYALYSILENTLEKEILFLRENRDSYCKDDYFEGLIDYMIKTRQKSGLLKNKLMKEYNTKKNFLQRLMNIKPDKEDFDDNIFIFN